MRKRNSKAGFSLIEVLVSCSLFSVILLTTLGLLTLVSKYSSEKTVRQELFDQSQMAMDILSEKLQSYDRIEVYPDTYKGTLNSLKLYKDNGETDLFTFVAAKGRLQTTEGHNEVAVHIQSITIQKMGDSCLTLEVLSKDSTEPNGKKVSTPIHLSKIISTVGKELRFHE